MILLKVALTLALVGVMSFVLGALAEWFEAFDVRDRLDATGMIAINAAAATCAIGGVLWVWGI